MPTKSTVLHVQRREKSSSMPNQKIQVQVPAKFIMQTQKMAPMKTSEGTGQKRLIVQSAQYPKQTVMLQTPNKSQVQNSMWDIWFKNHWLFNCFSVPTTVYQKTPINQIFLKDSAKTFVIQRPKESIKTPKQATSQPSSSSSNSSGGGNISQAVQSQVTAYDSTQTHYQQKQPTRLTTNGSSYEIKGIPPNQNNYQNGNRQQHIFEVVNRKSIIQVCHWIKIRLLKPNSSRTNKTIIQTQLTTRPLAHHPKRLTLPTPPARSPSMRRSTRLRQRASRVPRPKLTQTTIQVSLSAEET